MRVHFLAVFRPEKPIAVKLQFIFNLFDYNMDDTLDPEELNEMLAETNPLEDMIGELDTKLNDQKRKKADAKKQIEDMMKGVQKFKPSQLDGMLASLEELKDKNCWISEKLQAADGKLDQQLQELEDLVANCDTKQELLQ